MEETEVKLTPEAEAIVGYASATEHIFTELYKVVFSEGWKNWELNEQLIVREMLAQFVMAGNILREKFDGDVWKGHADGTVNDAVESIRKQREGDTPGRKKKELTPAELLAKRLKKD